MVDFKKLAPPGIEPWSISRGVEKHDMALDSAENPTMVLFINRIIRLK